RRSRSQRAVKADSMSSHTFLTVRQRPPGRRGDLVVLLERGSRALGGRLLPRCPSGHRRPRHAATRGHEAALRALQKREQGAPAVHGENTARVLPHTSAPAYGSTLGGANTSAPSC